MDTWTKMRHASDTQACWLQLYKHALSHVCKGSIVAMHRPPYVQSLYLPLLVPCTNTRVCTHACHEVLSNLDSSAFCPSNNTTRADFIWMEYRLHAFHTQHDTQPCVPSSRTLVWYSHLESSRTSLKTLANLVASAAQDQ